MPIQKSLETYWMHNVYVKFDFSLWEKIYWFLLLEIFIKVSQSQAWNKWGYQTHTINDFLDKIDNLGSTIGAHSLLNSTVYIYGVIL